MNTLPIDISMGTGVEAARLAVPLQKIGRTDSEKGRICEADLRPKDERFWSQESDHLIDHAASIIDCPPSAEFIPHPINFPLILVLDPDIAKLVLSKEKNPFPDFTFKDLPDCVRNADMDPIAAEQLLLVAQVRRVLDLLEIAVMRRDYVNTENATRGLAMRSAGIALLSMQGARAREDFCETYYMKFKWTEIVTVLSMDPAERPLEDTKDRTPL